MSFALKPGMLPLFDGASEASIQNFEREYGYDLPADYRRFLREVNGFRRDTSFNKMLHFPIKERWIGAHNKSILFPPFVWPPVGEVFAELVDCPWGLKGLSHTTDASDIGSSNFLVAEDTGYGFASRMPKHFLVIGDTTSNAFICLECSGEAFGRIYLWGSEYDPDATAEEELEGLELIADTFQEFWDSLLPLDKREMVH